MTGTYYNDGNKRVWGLAGGPSQAMIDFLNKTGIYSKTIEIFKSGSYWVPAEGVWTLSTPGWGNIVAGVPSAGPNEPLFEGSQPVGVVTTPAGFSLFNALTPEQWGNVRNLSDISLVLRFQYMPYDQYRNIESYEKAPVQETIIDTTKIVYDPSSGIWNTVNPQTIQEIQQQLQSLTETVASILLQIQEGQSFPELQQQYEALQRAQLELAELVETLSKTIEEIENETQTNTETLEQIKEQLETALELMDAVQPALEELNQVQDQVQTLMEQLNGVITENDIIVQNLGEIQDALKTLQQEYPELRQQVQNVLQTLEQVQTEIETLSTTQAQTEEQYERIVQYIQDIHLQIQTVSQTIQNISVDVDLSPVVNAVNEVANKVDALSEQVRSLDAYLRVGFFEKLGEKIKEILETLFVPKQDQLNELFKIELPSYKKEFAADVSFSSYSTSIPIRLFGSSVDLSDYIAEYATPLRNLMNIFVSGLAAMSVIRAFRVHLNID